MPQGRGMLTGKSAEVVVEDEPRRTESGISGEYLAAEEKGPEVPAPRKAQMGRDQSGE